jgi:uncharacterized membrane protein YfcA
VGLAAALLLSLLIGLALGTLGSGGSIITMPVLVYVAGVPVQRAVGMSLVVVGTTAAIGSWVQSRHTGLDRRAAAIFAVTGLAGAVGGARLTHLVPGALLMTMFAALMIGAGLRMRAPQAAGQAGRACSLTRCVGAGVVLGVLTGFLGVGGGFLILPVLVLLAGIEMKRAVPTSLAVIAVNAAGGLVGQLEYIDLDWPVTLSVLACALAGMLAGTAVAARVAADRLRTAFAWTILAVGAAVLAREALRAAGVV